MELSEGRKLRSFMVSWSERAESFKSTVELHINPKSDHVQVYGAELNLYEDYYLIPKNNTDPVISDVVPFTKGLHGLNFYGRPDPEPGQYYVLDKDLNAFK